MKIYVCPAVIDLLGYFFIFAILYGASSAGVPEEKCFWIGAIQPVTYMLSSLALSKILGRGNMLFFIVSGTILMVISGTAGLYFTSFNALMLSMASIGVFMAFFFNAFQTLMRNRTPPGGLNRTVALYTASWSLGSSSGYIISGQLYSFGFAAMASAGVVAGLTTLAMVYLVNREPEMELTSDEHIEEGPEGSRPVNHSYVIIGWIMIFTIMFTQRAICTFFPIISAQEGISSRMTSFPLFLNFLIQGVFGYWMWRHRRELYRRKSIIISHLGAALVFLAIWSNPSYVVCVIGLCLLGIYAGFAYFCAVYYASNSGNRTFNIGINEFIVGLGSLAGIVCCEWWMREFESKAGMYLLCAIVTFASLALQLAFAKGPLSEFTGRKIGGEAS